MHKSVTQLITTLLLTCMLIACGESDRQSNDTSDKKNTPNEQSKQDNMVSFYNDNFSILKPNTWKTMHDLNEEANIQIGNASKDVYAIVLTEDKVDFYNASLQDFSDITRNIIEKKIKKFKESPPEKLTINGLAALKYTLTGSINLIELKYTHVSIETEDHFHQMVLWCLASKFNKNESIFNDVIQSFKANP